MNDQGDLTTWPPGQSPRLPSVAVKQRPAALPRGTQLLILTACVWVGSFVLSTVRDLAAPPHGFAAMTAWRLLFACLGAALCYPLHQMLDALRGRSFSQRLLLSLPALAVAALTYTEGTLIVQKALGSDTSQFGSSFRFYNTIYWSLFFLAWAALHLALSYSRELAEQSERARASEALAHDAQLRALRYQIDPHFLFNTLNSVSALVVTKRNDEAENMLTKLSRFFRASVAIDPNAFLTLPEEIELQRLYLAIEQVRYPDLDVSIEISDQARSAAVPALLLQPIVENAIKFGVTSRQAPARILISVQTRNNQLHIEVVNDADDASDRHGTGTGLRNTRDRLAALYGDLASLETTCDSGQFHVELTLPLETIQ